MQAFHVRYRNSQGTLMRILNAASRRGIELPYVQASPADGEHAVTLLLQVSTKQIGQLRRDWHAIVDVVEVRAGVPFVIMPHGRAEVAMPHPVGTVGVSSPAAMA